MLLAQFTRMFPPAIRGRGADCQRAGAVRILAADERQIRAVVKGTDEYDVNLRGAPAGLAVSCSCAYFSDRGPCKHLWATLATAEEQGTLAKLDRDPQGDTFGAEVLPIVERTARRAFARTFVRRRRRGTSSRRW